MEALDLCTISPTGLLSPDEITDCVHHILVLVGILKYSSILLSTFTFIAVIKPTLGLVV